MAIASSSASGTTTTSVKMPVIAFAVGYAVIAWFMKFIETHTFTPFMIYRIVLALGLFALLGTGTISA